jgi:predicted NAD-dependent protein-ADP-ribosyltransferase YbiA (DUF1768 family)
MPDTPLQDRNSLETTFNQYTGNTINQPEIPNVPYQSPVKPKDIFAFSGPKKTPLQEWEESSKDNQGKLAGGSTSMPFKDLTNARFSSFDPTPGVDNEDAFARSQGFWDKAANGTIKMLGIAGNTAVSSTLGAINGLAQWSDTGKFSSFYDNEFTHKLDDQMNQMEQMFPHFKTGQQRSSDWYSPVNLFTANFVFDSIVKNLGYSLGASVPALGVGKALNALKLSSRLFAAGEALAATETIEAATALPRIQQLGYMEGRLQSIVRGGKTATGNILKGLGAESIGGVEQGGHLVQGIASALSSSGEASMEAYNNLNQFRNERIKEYKDKNGFDPEGTDLEAINRQAENVGNSSYLLNTALLTGTQYVQLPKIFSSTFKGEKNLLNATIQDAETGLFRSALPEKGLGKILYKAKNIASLGFNEAEAFEEGAQYAIQTGTQDYYNKKYRGQDANFLSSLGYGLGEALTTPEGLENVFLGGLSGALMTSGFISRQGIGKTGKIGERGWTGYGGQKATNTDEFVKGANQFQFTNYLKDGVDQANRAITLQEQREAAIRQGDILESKDLEFDYSHNYLSNRIKWGRYDLVESDINDARQAAANPESFAQLQQDGKAAQTDTPQTFIARLNNFQEHAKNVKEQYEDLNTKYGGLIDKEGKKIYSPEVIDKLVYAASKVRDYDKRIPELSTDLLAKGIQVQNVLEDVLKLPITERAELSNLTEYEKKVIQAEKDYVGEKKEPTPLRQALKDIKDLSTVSEVKDDLRQKLQDVIELTQRRKQYINDYDTIKGNPKRFEDIPVDNKARIKQVEEGKTVNSELEVGKTYTLASDGLLRDGNKLSINPTLTIISKTLSNTYEVKKPDGSTTFMTPQEFKRYSIKEVQDNPEELNKILDETIDASLRKKGFDNILPEDATLQDKLDFINTLRNKTLVDDIQANYRENSKVLQQQLAEKKAKEEKFKKDQELQKKFEATVKALDSDENTEDPEAPADVPELGQGFKVDLEIIARTGTSQKYEDADLNSPTRREHTFLFNKSKGDFLERDIKTILVTKNTEEHLGLKGIIDPLHPDTIRIVYVETLPDGTFTYLDKDGVATTNVDEMAYGTMRDESLSFSGGDSFRNPSDLDPEVIKKNYAQFRKNILELTDKDLQNPSDYFIPFKTSRGLPNTTQGNKTNLLDTGIIKKEDLFTPLIQVPTRGRTTFGEEGDTVNMPLGKVIFNRLGNMFFMNSRNLSNKEASNIADILIKASEELTSTGEISPRLSNYLRGVLFFKDPAKVKQRSRNQVFFTQDKLIVGNNELDLFSLNKDQLTSLLEGVYTYVDNKHLLDFAKAPTSSPFEELYLEAGEVKGTMWPSYQHYLLEPRPQGAPLTTTIIKQVDKSDIPIVQKYPILDIAALKQQNSPVPTSTQQKVEAKVIEKEESKRIVYDNKTINIAYTSKNEPISFTTNGQEIEIIKNDSSDAVYDRLIKAGMTPEAAKAAKAAISGTVSNTILKDKTQTQQEVEQKQVEEEQKEVDVPVEPVDKIADIERRRQEELLNFIPSKLKILKNKIFKFIEEKENNTIGRWNSIKKQLSFRDDATKATLIHELIHAFLDEKISNKKNLEFKHRVINILQSALKITSEENSKTIRYVVEVYNDPFSSIHEELITWYLTDREFRKEIDALPEYLTYTIYKLISEISGFSNEEIEAFKEFSNSETSKELYKKFYDKINAKYDAELAALKGKRTFTPKTYDGGATRLNIKALTLIGDKLEEDKEVERMLPQVKVQTVDNLINVTGGGKAWGYTLPHFIAVWEEAPYGVKYHESFEQVFNFILNNRGRKELYNEFKSREGNFTTFEGIEKAYKDATLVEAKEEIADEFAQYKTDGTLVKSSPAKKNFFQQLLAFLKNLFTGKPLSVEKAFYNLAKGGYANARITSPIKIQPEYKRTVVNTPESLVQDTIVGMTTQLFLNKWEKDASLIQQLEENEQEATKTLFEQLYIGLDKYFTSEDDNSLYAYLSQEAQKDSSKTDQLFTILDQVQANWKNVQMQWGNYAEDLKSFLKSFDVAFTIDDDGNVTYNDNVEEDREERSQSDYNSESKLFLNSKNSASKTIKLLFATVVESKFVFDETANKIGQIVSKYTGNLKQLNNNQMMMPNLASYAKLFNYTLDNAANLNGIEKIIEHLRSVSSNRNVPVNANLEVLLNRLGYDNVATFTPSDKSAQAGEHTVKGWESLDDAGIKILLKFENALSKSRPEFFVQYSDKNDHKILATNISDKAAQLKTEWVENMQSARGVISDGNRIKFNRSILNKDPFVVLANLGIPITQEDFDRLPKNRKAEFTTALNKLVEDVKEYTSKFLPINAKYNDLSFNSRLGTLADIYSKYIVGNTVESQHSNANGEYTANKILPNYMAYIFNDANASQTLEEFKQLNPQYNDLYMGDSYYLNEVVFSDGTKTNFDLKTVISEGRKSPLDGAATSSLTQGERLVYEINNNLNEIYYSLLPADSSTEWGLRLKNILPKTFFTSKEATLEDYTQKMWSALKNEIALAKDFESRKNIENLNRNGDGRKLGESLRFFQGILSKELVQDINELIDLNEDISEDMYPKFKEELSKFIEGRAKDTIKTLKEFKLIREKTDKFDLAGVDTKFLKEVGKLTQERLDDLFFFREANYIFNNIELHKLLFNDPYQYKDAEKRIKSFLSGREYSNQSEKLNEVNNTRQNKSGDYTLQPTDFGYLNHSNNIRVQTVRNVLIQSNEVDDIKESMGKKGEAYNKTDVADGQSWMEPTVYKQTLLKAGGRWESKQEELHQWLMAYQRNAMLEKGQLEESKYPKALQAADKQILKKSINDATLQILKPIASGVKMANGVATQYLYKTSTAPLYYYFVEGTPAEQILLNMQKNNIGMLAMESSHKVGVETNKIQDLFDEKGNIQDFTTHSDIDYKYFGIQVETKGTKDYQTQGSQLTKLALQNLMNMGVPINTTKKEWDKLTEEQRLQNPIYKLVKKHNELLSAMAIKRSEKLFKELNIKKGEFGYTIEDKKKVADFILKELERRELPNNFGVGIETVGGEFKTPLEANVNYKKIKQILWSTIENNILRPKVSGGPKILLTALGYDNIVPKTINGKTVLTSSKLKFYTKDGGKTKACQIAIPFFFGVKILNQIEKSQGIKFKTQKEGFKHVLDYLNNTEEGKTLLEGIGFRIPTQGLNSVDFFEIAEFLPPQMGDTIIFPSEITTKTGGDFDVDKMSTYLKNFYINREGYPVSIQYMNESNSSLEERYIRYVSDNNRIKGLMEEFKNSEEYLNTQDKIDKSYQEAQKKINELKEKYKEDKSKLRSSINKNIDLVDHIYNEGYDIFKTLPKSIKQIFWSNESELLGKGVKGDQKTIFYSTLATALEDSIDEKLKQGIISDQLAFTNKEGEKDVELVDYTKIKAILENLQENYNQVLDLRGLNTRNLAKYSDFKNKVSDSIKANADILLGATSKEARSFFKEFLLDASKVIAEGNDLASIEQFALKSIEEQNSIEALENEYYNTIRDLASLEENYARLVTPNDASQLKGIAGDIEKKNNKTKYSLSNAARLLDSSYMSFKRHLFLIMKKGVGIAAVGNTNLALNQIVDFKMAIPKSLIENFGVNRNFAVRFDYNKSEDGLLHLSGTQNKLGDWLSDLHSQVIDGTVDVARDEWLAGLIGDSSALGPLLFMFKLGISPRTAAYFLNQPAIQDYLRSKGIHKNISRLALWVKPKMPTQIEQDIQKTILGKYSRAEQQRMWDSKPEIYKGLEDTIGKSYTELTKEEQIQQIQMLSDYIGFEKLASNLFTAVDAYNVDTTSFTSPEVVDNKELAYQKATKLKPIEGEVDNLMENTFLAGVKQSMLNANEGLSSVLNTQRGEAKRALDRMLLKLYTQFFSMQSRIKYQERAELSLIDFVINTQAEVGQQPINSQAIMQALLFKTGNISDFVRAAQEHPILKNNKIIQNIQAIEEAREGYPSYIKLKEQDYDTYTSNLWTDSLKELRDSNIIINVKGNDRTSAQLLDAILLSQILQYGSTRTKGSFLHLIPNDKYSELVSPVLRNIKNAQAWVDNNYFYRNNWKDSVLVPEAQLDFVEIEPGRYERVIPKANSVRTYLDYKTKKATFVSLKTEFPEASFIHQPVSSKNLPFIKITDLSTEERKTDLYQRVDAEENAPIQVGIYDEDASTGMPYSVYSPHVLYVKVNKLGNENLKEYTPTSKLAENKPVPTPDMDSIAEVLSEAKVLELTNLTTSEPDVIEEEPDTSLYTQDITKAVLNIYAGTNENANLSNFAKRPFTINYEGLDIVGQFNTVEGAFQALKAGYTSKATVEEGAKNSAIVEKLRTATGAQAKALGRQIKKLDITDWDEDSSSIMKDLLTKSFEQNPEALQVLLNTGNSILTHTQDKGKWGTEFPKLLMEVREDLQKETKTPCEGGLPF